MPLYNVMGNPVEEPASNTDLLNKNFKSRMASRDSKTGSFQERTNMNPDLQFLDVKDSIMAMLSSGGDAKNQTFNTYAQDLRKKLGDANAMKVISSIATYNQGTRGMNPKERINNWFSTPHQDDYVGKLSGVLKNAYGDYSSGSSVNADVQSMTTGRMPSLAGVVSR